MLIVQNKLAGVFEEVMQMEVQNNPTIVYFH